MRRVSDFLEIPYEAGLATLEGADRGAIHGGEHHSLLRGTQIVAGTRPEMLDDALRAKIERYVRRWRRGRKDGWPRYAALREGESSVPGLAERLRDRALYRVWRAVDAFTRVVFCYAPLGWLRWYRQRKGSKA
jgi:hypothetical protein